MATLVNRAYNISDKDSFPTEMKHLTTALQRNGYRKKLVLKRATKEEERRRNAGIEDQGNEDGERETSKRLYVTIPYIAGTSEKISRILHKHDVVTRYSSVTKIGDYLPGPKDTIPQELYEGVYRVPCSCGKAYIGETCHSLHVRMKEHQRATKNKQFQLSAIAEHAWSEPGHDICFDEKKLLAKECRYFPRQIREAIEIHKTPKNFNRDDGYPLHSAWKRLIRETTNDRAARGQPSASAQPG